MELRLCANPRPVIRDPIDRPIIGAINLSGLTAIFQKHNAAFAGTAAREIEIALERAQSILHLRLLEPIIGTVPMQTDPGGEGIAVVDKFGRLIFNRNCAGLPQFVNVGATVRNGKRLLNLSSKLSEASILSALPLDHTCQEIRLIRMDGVVKGAVAEDRHLVLRSAGHAAAPRTPTVSCASSCPKAPV